MYAFDDYSGDFSHSDNGNGSNGNKRNTGGEPPTPRGKPISIQRKKSRNFPQIPGGDWLSQFPGIFRAALIFGGISIAFVVLGAVLSIFSNDPVVMQQQLIGGAETEEKQSEGVNDRQLKNSSEELWREVRETQASLDRQRQLFREEIEASRGVRWQVYVNQHCLKTGCDDSYTKLFDRRQAIVTEIESLIQYGAIATDAKTIEEFRRLDAELADIDAALSAPWGANPQHKISGIDYLKSVTEAGEAIGRYNNPILRGAHRQQDEEAEE